MAAILHGLRRKATDVLSLDQMSKSFNILAVNYIYVMMYYTLESVFVNTLLYRISPEMSIVLKYRAMVYIASALAMNVGAYISKHFSPILTIRLGGFAYIIMYSILFTGMNYMDRLMYLVAFFSGTGGGLYFGGHNVLLTLYTNGRNRGLGVSIMGLIQGFMTLLVPIISGFVISLLPGSFGYRVMFGIGALVVVLQGGMQRKLVPVEMRTRDSQISLAIKLVLRKATCKLMLGSEFVRGLRDGLFTFFLNMVLFEIVTSESLVGVNTFLTGIMAIAGSWAYGKLAVPGRRVKLVVLATTILLACNMLLFVSASVEVVILFALLNAFCSLFIVYTVNTFSFDVMAQNETMRSCMAEIAGFRETALSAGRLTGFFIVTLFPANLTGYIQAMCVLTATQYIAALLDYLIKKTMERKQIKRMSVHV